MVWVLLVAAIAAEVVGTLATGLSDGFTRPLPTGVVVVGVVGAYFLLSLVTARGVAIGVAYAIWSGLGVTAVAVLGAVIFDDTLTWGQVAGMVLVVGGVAALEMGTAPELAGEGGTASEAHR
ncbi:multidrug efflux SMR transporter [Actinobacteria bacterium YIM 96077]|uniref:QacE family quaternary ammonium compound efflux SMR transporter n=1 Tax=Phytoactinopolyspora halophila TaxID=1981511 RepID=A0A329QT74_9ACTN|nr:multidrug efflux SMR transporter [Phytoactinopolyspora halophila]AYY14976.1 multidrug efflux SMR transporter [Actinobacteria bacterium YIM 96077]RAW15433.1 QacE family quaternary ammonium compound efflux SMR transporter [Phytoactinopolyspora halophila]